MEKFNLEKDINVLYVTAKSFPAGIMEAFDILNSKISASEGRSFFGISYPDEKGEIIYKAAAEEIYEGEGKKSGCETFLIKKGTYISIEIKNFMSDIPAIGKVFKELLSHPGIDPQGVCVECYLNQKDVRCMVRLK